MPQNKIQLIPLGATLPDNLPSAEDIVAECLQGYITALAAAESSRATINPLRGISLANKSAFVKFANDLELREARIQHFVWEALRKNASIAVRVPCVYGTIKTAAFLYIVMEHIEGSVCSSSNADVALVAAALQELITIQGPNIAPGPVDPGPICHSFFFDYVSSVTYSSVMDLQSHINGILKKAGYKDKSVDLETEVQEHGLRLCPSDMNRTNFMKDTNGKIVAIDFGQTSFLPISFFDFAINASEPFAKLLAQHVNYPKSRDLDALQTASSILVPYRSNDVGLPPALKAKLAVVWSESIGRG